jgi:hypothetical protein
MKTCKDILALYSIIFLVFFVSQNNTMAQCTNTTQFPASTLSAPVFTTPTVLNTNSFAGQYIKLQGLVLNKTYQFSSDNASDYLTIRDKDGITLLAHGTSPVNLSVGAGPDIITIHINLISPPCGTQNTNRTITATCTDCPPEPPKVGIGINTPQAKLDVNGKIKFGDDSDIAQAGMVRWNAATSDFEGYDGQKWISFTKSNSSWGELPINESRESAKLTASDGAAGDFFGNSVAIKGDFAVIGAFADDIGSSNAPGSAYIFIRSGTSWTQQTKLTASDGDALDYFGYSVDISENYAVIGAFSDDVGANAAQGSAYVFIRSGTSWTQQAKLTASDGAANDNFGKSVAISGDYAVIGANLDDVGANTSQGSAYVFVRSGTSWTQQAKLTASDGAANEEFGNSVSLSGNYAVIGAYGDVIGANGSQGSAYIFHRSGTTWTQQAKLTASDGASADWFGYSVAISGDYVIIGAYGDDEGTNTEQGSAYVYIRSGTSWSQQAKLTASDGTDGDYFGNSVAISGDYVVIGAYRNLIGGNTNQGSAYIFARSGTSWTQQSRLRANDGNGDDYFGVSVAISGNYAVIGAGSDDAVPNTDQGSAYIFVKN